MNGVTSAVPFAVRHQHSLPYSKMESTSATYAARLAGRLMLLDLNTHLLRAPNALDAADPGVNVRVVGAVSAHHASQVLGLAHDRDHVAGGEDDVGEVGFVVGARVGVC